MDLKTIVHSRLIDCEIECSHCKTKSWVIVDAYEGINQVVGFEAKCVRCDRDIIVRGSIQPYSGKLRISYNGIRAETFIYKPKSG